MMRSGFSLVELSIVLVILGLLTGGILAGQSLIRASELRAVSSEHGRFVTAAYTFRDRYFALPGDFSNAVQVWGRLQTSNCLTNSTTTAGTPGACDGDADGQIVGGGGAGTSRETMQFWRHLALAGLIEGTYSGLVGPGGTDDSVIGTNVPASKLNAAGWSIKYVGANPGNSNHVAYDYGNLMYFGSAYATGPTFNPVITPSEAWNIDTKMDDGMPATGKVFGFPRNPCGNSSGVSDYAATYRLSSSDTSCSLMFPRFL